MTSIIFVLQNLYQKVKVVRSISLNSHVSLSSKMGVILYKYNHWHVKCSQVKCDFSWTLTSALLANHTIVSSQIQHLVQSKTTSCEHFLFQARTRFFISRKNEVKRIQQELSKIINEHFCRTIRTDHKKKQQSTITTVGRNCIQLPEKCHTII